MLVLGVLFEVEGQEIDLFGEESDLNFRRAGITLVGLEVPDELLFGLSFEHHGYAPFLGKPGGGASPRFLM